MYPTHEQYYCLEEWIKKWGELQKYYFIVYPDTTVIKIIPEDFENFKTCKSVIGDIRKFYSQWKLLPN